MPRIGFNYRVNIEYLPFLIEPGNQIWRVFGQGLHLPAHALLNFGPQAFGYVARIHHNAFDGRVR